MILEVAFVILSFVLGYIIASHTKMKRIWDIEEVHDAQIDRHVEKITELHHTNRVLRDDLERFRCAVDGYQRELTVMREELNSVSAELYHYQSLAAHKTATETKKRSTRPGKAARAAAKRRRQNAIDLGVTHVPTQPHHTMLAAVEESHMVSTVAEPTGNAHHADSAGAVDTGEASSNANAETRPSVSGCGSGDSGSSSSYSSDSGSY